MSYLTLEEHLETATDLAIAKHHLEKAFYRCHNHHKKSSKLMQHFYRYFPDVFQGSFAKILMELDSDYQKLADDEVFKKHGFLYSNLHHRYEKYLVNLPA